MKKKSKIYMDIYSGALEDCIIDPFNKVFVYYDDDSATLTIRKNGDVIHLSKHFPVDYDSKAKLLNAYIKDCVMKSINNTLENDTRRRPI